MKKKVVGYWCIAIVLIVFATYFFLISGVVLEPFLQAIPVVGEAIGSFDICESALPHLLLGKEMLDGMKGAAWVLPSKGTSTFVIIVVAALGMLCFSFFLIYMAARFVRVAFILSRTPAIYREIVDNLKNQFDIRFREADIVTLPTGEKVTGEAMIKKNIDEVLERYVVAYFLSLEILGILVVNLSMASDGDYWKKDKANYWVQTMVDEVVKKHLLIKAI